MITPIQYSRAKRALFVISLVCLVTTLATSVFVAAGGGDNERPEKRATTTAAPVDAAVKAKVAERFGRLPLEF